MFLLLLLVTHLSTICCHSTADGNQVITITRPKSRNAKLSNKDDWGLRYFPDKSYKPPSDPKTYHFANKNDNEIVDSQCDDGKKNLYLDWDESMTLNYTCSTGKLYSDEFISPIVHGDFILPYFYAPHFCMNQVITYPNEIVTFGGHRPLWGRYGEYEFIPKQRWLHNAEHGAVIMLYHPCAPEDQVDKLRNLVTSCLYRHIITPYNLLPVERPLALITWGWYLGMNVVHPKLVIRFILEHACRGPENIESDGKYDYGLQKAARIVSDKQDSVLCQGIKMM